MAEHPIEGLMKTAMESIKDMVDVNTIVGDAVQAPDGTVIIPISKVTFGFAAGGGDYSKACGCEVSEDSDDEGKQKSSKDTNKFPFAGGSGAGVSISPVAFMVVGSEQLRLIPVGINTSVDRIIDLLPEIMTKANDVVKKRVVVKKEIKKGEKGETEEKTVKESESD